MKKESIKDLALGKMENPLPDALSRIDSIAPAHSATTKYPIALATSVTVKDLSSFPKQHINEVKNLNFQIGTFTMPTLLTLQQLSAEQSKDEKLKDILADKDYPLILKRFTWGESFPIIYCNFKGDLIWPYLPKSLCGPVMRVYHDLAHPDPKATNNIVRQKYVWANMSREIIT